MKGGLARPWATQKINQILNPLLLVLPTWQAFKNKLDIMFADPNQEATTRRKLAPLHQGSESMENLIHQFEIHSPPSKLGDVGLVDHFEQAIHQKLHESIYRLQPIPSTWPECK